MRNRLPLAVTNTPTLRDQVAATVARLHPHPEQLHCCDVLYKSLLRLYSHPPTQIWDINVKPFLDSEGLALEIIYAEHAALPEAEVLDLVEGLLVLERLQNDYAHLRERWPLGYSSLATLGAAWGTPLDRVA
jgi:hypothetical protein